MKKLTYKKYLKFANLSFKSYLLNHEIVKELKDKYGEDEIEEYLMGSNILQDAGVNGEISSFNNFVKDIEDFLERYKIQKECEGECKKSNQKGGELK